MPAPRLSVVRLSNGVPRPLAKLSVPPVKAAPEVAATVTEVRLAGAVTPWISFRVPVELTFNVGLAMDPLRFRVPLLTVVAPV